MQDVASFLRAHRIRLSKDLGQHFLIDDAVLEDILEAAKIQLEDHIVEIGTGIGVLTRELVQRAKTVTAIEIDARMIPLLEKFVVPTLKKQMGGHILNIIHGNALEVDFPEEAYAIVANIPYQITSPLLRHAFLESTTRPNTLTLMIQREVAEKICRPFETLEKKNQWDDAGMLTILVGLFGTPRYVRTVPPSAFLPPPKVESAVMHIQSHPRPIVDFETMEEIFRLTKAAFSQKRKMLRNTLGAFHGGMERLKAASISPERRPQTVTIAEWVSLARVSRGKMANGK